MPHAADPGGGGGGASTKHSPSLARAPLGQLVGALVRCCRPWCLQVPARQFPVTVHFSRRTEMHDYVGAAFRKVRARRLLPMLLSVCRCATAVVVVIVIIVIK